MILGDELSTGDVAEFLEEDEGTSSTPNTAPHAFEMDKIVKKAKRKKKVVNF